MPYRLEEMLLASHLLPYQRKVVSCEVGLKASKVEKKGCGGNQKGSESHREWSGNNRNGRRGSRKGRGGNRKTKWFSYRASATSLNGRGGGKKASASLDKACSRFCVPCCGRGEALTPFSNCAALRLNYFPYFCPCFSKPHSRRSLARSQANCGLVRCPTACALL